MSPGIPPGGTEGSGIFWPQEESTLKLQEALYRQYMCTHVLPIMKCKDRGLGRRKTV